MKNLTKLQKLIIASQNHSIEILPPVVGVAKDHVFRQADLFVLPTFSENFGLVIAEALSYGVPVITTSGTPWQELVTTNSGWWVMPEKNHLIGSLSEATSMSNADLAKMGRNGQQLIKSKYTWGSIGVEMMKAYRSVL